MQANSQDVFIAKLMQEMSEAIKDAPAHLKERFWGEIKARAAERVHGVRRAMGKRTRPPGLRCFQPQLPAILPEEEEGKHGDGMDNGAAGHGDTQEA